MAITSYSELLAAGANWLHRSDLTSRFPEFIALLEAGLNYGLSMPELGIDMPGLRVRQMETRVTATIDAEYEDVPSDFLETRQIRLNTSPRSILEYTTPAQIDATWGGSTTGQPRMFSMVGDSFRFAPSPDASYTAELIYYAKVPALTASNTTNWLLTARPDIYLYGMLMHSAPYLNDPRIATWAQGFKGAVAGLQKSDTATRWSGGVLRQRTSTGSP